MIQNEIDKMLLREGFCFLQARPQEAGVYYRECQSGMQVVLGIWYHPGFTLGSEQLDHMKKQIKSYLEREWGCSHIEMLTLFLAEHMEGLREICAEDNAVWILDAKERRLVIYENQRGEFGTLRGKLQQVLDQPGITDGAGENASRDGQAVRRDVAGSRGQQNIKWRELPWATIFLVAVNVIVFAVLEWMGDTNDGEFMYRHGASYPEAVVTGKEYYRLFTCMFLHFGMEHLLNNMVLLGCVGSRLERYCGAWRFLLMYLIAGLGSSVLSVAQMESSGEYAVAAGASGAIFGIIGALFFVALKNRGKVEGLTTRGLMIMIALCLYYGFVSAGIDNWGHIGGLITGFVISTILGRRQNARKHNI